MANAGITATLSSRIRLDVNLSATFVELALAMTTAWGKEGNHVLRRARGGDAPYRIRNLTGGPINVWSDLDGSQSTHHIPAVKISQGETVEWRFDDWKTMREVRAIYLFSRWLNAASFSNHPLPDTIVLVSNSSRNAGSSFAVLVSIVL